MSDFNATYPQYAATARLDALRASEYSYLDEGGHVYLDYTGAGLSAQHRRRPDPPAGVDADGMAA